MDSLPTYYSSTVSPPPPSYEASVYAAQQEQESIWPRNYCRQTPRIDVVKFYHNLILTCPQELEYQQELDQDKIPFHSDDDDDDADDDDDDDDDNGDDSLQPSSLSTMEFDNGNDERAVSELNQLLLQTWTNQNNIPSYEAFKAQVSKNQSLRPISNNLFRSSST